MKKLLIALAVLGLLGAGAAYVVYTSAGKIVKTAIEEFGPKVLGAPVTVRSVRLSPFSGKGSIHGLVVGNPPGFQTPSAFELGSVHIWVDYKSLLTDKIRVREVRVASPKVTFETGAHGSNIAALQKNVESFAGPSSGGSSGPAKKLQLDLFDLSGGEVGFSTKLLGSKPITAPLPPVHIEGLGKGKEGVTPGDATKVVFHSIYASVLKAVATVPGVGEAVDDAKKVVGEAAKTANQAVSGITGLFKKKKK
ncbi:MAG TPA: hypothetical protein VNI01_08450 [Elusimicrobiota bacterium]|jgi:hypothetical protein|nr:hypothetical protein [Elusimicrobiota bacterium]